MRTCGADAGGLPGVISAAVLIFASVLDSIYIWQMKQDEWLTIDVPASGRTKVPDYMIEHGVAARYV